jgi:GNAT superfamily N-acetyltransferase
VQDAESDRADIVIEAADSRDVPALLQLLAELFAQEHDFRPDTDKQLHGLRLILAHPERGRLFVARRSGEVVAMANALFTISTAEGGPVVLLEDVVVSSRYRGSGIGSRLLDHILQWAREEGFLRVSLVTDADNHGAQRFYQRLGFTPSEMKLLRRNLE